MNEESDKPKPRRRPSESISTDRIVRELEKHSPRARRRIMWTVKDRVEEAMEENPSGSTVPDGDERQSDFPFGG